MFKEDEIGSIEPGSRADFVVWERDSHSMPTGSSKGLRARLMLLGGEIAHRAADAGILVEPPPAVASPKRDGP